MDINPYVELGLTVAGFIGGVATTRTRVGNLERRVNAIEKDFKVLPDDYVRRSEFDLALRFFGTSRRDIAIGPVHASAAEPMHYSTQGLALTEASESCSLIVYFDADGVPTIGFGHTGPDVHPGMTITRDQAIALLHRDLAWAEDCVNIHVTVPLHQGQFDALVDFVFNEGPVRFLHSTLLSKLNRGDYAGAFAQFAVWVMGGGRTLGGLVRRRAAEQALFNEQENASHDAPTQV